MQAVERIQFGEVWYIENVLWGCDVIITYMNRQNTLVCILLSGVLIENNLSYFQCITLKMTISNEGLGIFPLEEAAVRLTQIWMEHIYINTSYLCAGTKLIPLVFGICCINTRWKQKHNVARPRARSRQGSVERAEKNPVINSQPAYRTSTWLHVFT